MTERRRHFVRLAAEVIALLFALVGWLHGRAPAPEAPQQATAIGTPLAGAPGLSLGPVVGDVSSSGAVLWGRCDRATVLAMRFDDSDAMRSARVSEATDFTGKIALDSLSPDRQYGYHVWCGNDPTQAVAGTFRTAPDPAAPRRVSFAWGGDVGGQNVCRDRSRGYPIFARIADRRPAFFIGLGDMIYADDACLPIGRYGNPQLTGPPPATDLAEFRSHWRYNRADEHTQRMLAALPYYAVWDDHEIRNDSGPYDDESSSTPGVHLLPIALRAFLDYQPLLPTIGAPTRLYRSIRWGRHLEIFLLDTRQYRDALVQPVNSERPKTMLGAEQLAWLQVKLAQSNATWKVIVASVPLSIPTGAAAMHDGFADGGDGSGYEREAARILDTLHADGIRNSLWITTDVHFATGFVYRPFADDPTWTTYEFTSGPLNAGVFPQRRLDTTFHPQRLFFYGPPSIGAIASFEEAIGWFNFGVVDIDDDGTLSVSIVNGRGETVFHRRLSAA